MQMTLGEKIRKARKGKMTQAELAEAIGVHEMTIRRWELGERSPNIGALQKIANVLSIPLIELTDDTPQEQPLKQLLENLTKSLPINNDENKEKVKIKDPLFGTQWEYEPNKSQELGLAYWGSVVDNAQRVAKNGNEQEKAAALMMLRMAVDAITGAGDKQTGGNFIAVQENHQHVGDNYVKGGG